MKNNYAPIVLFVYNRPWHTRQTIESLQKNKLVKESEIIIYSDGAKNDKAHQSVNEVRSYINSIDGFKKVTIIERDKNWGLANSIIDGVTTVVNEYGRIIVLEDDLVTSPYFLKYMNDALDFYELKKNVISIHGYIYPLKNTENLPETFFIRGADCWGWATWQRGWQLFEADGNKLLKELQEKKLQKQADLNGSYGYTGMLKQQIKGKNDSWAIRWYISAFLQNKLTLYPKQSLVQNIGNDNSGTHCSEIDDFHISELNVEEIQEFNPIVQENTLAKRKIEEFFTSSTNILKKILYWLAR